ncbi:carbohydrate ABC transporter permease [uncultured Alsobacter sp.]|uniref:carbohydrate ABC transporter permease n=1 Tax=uncultured Alsobacter sp. TaxID=1748258 RepID=UPI0025E4049A|nr:carbohydrate ABC transporter permease [uncultured Alsobacter sp.]
MSATPQTRDTGRATSGGLGDLLLQILLVGNSFVMLFPILVMGLWGFKSTGEIFGKPFALPNFSNLTNFVTVLTQTNFFGYLLNSILITGGSILAILTLGTMAAYGLARYRFAGSVAIYLFFLAGLMVPLKLAIIPLFIQMRDLNLLDTRLGLVVIYTAMGLPSTVFIMTGFLRTLPKELEDAARIDGASDARIMWSVMLPLARPAMVIAAIHNAVPVWNDFFFPLIFVQTDSRKTLPQGLTAFMGEYTTNWGVLFAGLTLSALPITIVYILLSKQFIQGMTSGAVK